MWDEQPSSAGGWVGSTPAPPKKPPEEPPPEKEHKLSVVAVQSIACVVVLLLALLLRTVGGEPYAQLRRRFHESLMGNELLYAIALLWDGEPAESDGSNPASESTSPDTSPSQENAAPQESSAPQKESAPQENSAPQKESAPQSKPSAAAALSFGRLPPEGARAVSLRTNRLAKCPVPEGVVTSGYGYRENPTGSGEQFHRGMDIAAPEGTPIAAMYDGRVEETGQSRSLGNYVRLRHGKELEILYAHCASVYAEKGALVRAGETVAQVGHTGDATGSHLHIQVSCQGVVYNPRELLAAAAYV